MDRSSRVFRGTLLRISIFPPRCMRNVRSETLTTRTPATRRLAATIAWPCSSSRALIGEVADDEVLDQLDEIDGADVAAGLADGRREAAEHARPVLDRCPDGEAVRGAGGEGHGNPQTGRPMRPHDHGRQPGVPRPELREGALVLVLDRDPQLAGEDNALEVQRAHVDGRVPDVERDTDPEPGLVGERLPAVVDPQTRDLVPARWQCDHERALDGVDRELVPVAAVIAGDVEDDMRHAESRDDRPRPRPPGGPAERRGAPPGTRRSRSPRSRPGRGRRATPGNPSRPARDTDRLTRSASSRSPGPA